MTSQDHLNPSPRPAEPTSPASILERSMQEARRIRMDALMAAERNHAAMAAATQAKCDEMLAAAQRQAEAIVEAARFEAERVRAEVATASHATADGSGQTSAQMILEMSLAEAQQMLTKATDEAERVREYLVADAQATALETIRQAEDQANGLLHETALQLGVVREQARQIYERLGDVTRGLQPVAAANPRAGAPVDLGLTDAAGDGEEEGARGAAALAPAPTEAWEGEEEDASPVEAEAETASGSGAPPAPQEASKPVWVIDLRPPTAKPPSDPSDEPTSNRDAAYGPRDDGESLAQATESQTQPRPGPDPNASGIRRMLGR